MGVVPMPEPIPRLTVRPSFPLTPNLNLIARIKTALENNR